MKRILLWVGIGLVVLVLLAALGVHFFLDGAVKHGVETKGPELTKVDVKLEGVHLSLFSGSGTLKGLLVGNPKGFKTPHAITVSNASLTLKPGSVFGDKLVITSINVQAPDIFIELGSGGNNLNKILANLNESTASAPANEKEKEKKEGRKMEVDDFIITGAKVHGSVTGLGEQSMPIPDIHLKDLGTGPEGITAAELSKKVLAEITDKSVEALGKGAMNLKGLTGGTNNSAGKIGKSIGDLLKKK